MLLAEKQTFAAAIAVSEIPSIISIDGGMLTVPFCQIVLMSAA
jgi:hypothetical protein